MRPASPRRIESRRRQPAGLWAADRRIPQNFSPGTGVPPAEVIGRQDRQAWHRWTKPRGNPMAGRSESGVFCCRSVWTDQRGNGWLLFITWLS